MKELIEALQILMPYGNFSNPTHCENEILSIVGIDPDNVSDVDKKRLGEIGFIVDEGNNCFFSYRFGSHTGIKNGIIRELRMITDVEQFAHDLVSEGLGAGFHPDNDFAEYMQSLDGQTVPFYTDDEVELRNQLLDKAHEICQTCGLDIYEVMGGITHAELLSGMSDEE